MPRGSVAQDLEEAILAQADVEQAGSAVDEEWVRGSGGIRRRDRRMREGVGMAIGWKVRGSSEATSRSGGHPGLDALLAPSSGQAAMWTPSMSLACRTIWWVNPHSLSYQLMTFTRVSPTTLVM